MMKKGPDGVARDIRTAMVLSLSDYTTPELEAALERNGETNEIGTTVYNYGFGYIIPCFDSEEELNNHKKQIAPEIYAILQYARKHSCDMVCLDEEGPVMEDFPPIDKN